MKTSAQIVISVGMASAVFGLLLYTEEGGVTFGPHSEFIGTLAILGGFLCAVLGFAVNSVSRPNASVEEQSGDGPGTPLCPSCLAPTERLQDFCAECGSPLSSHAEIDPIGQIRSIGYTVGKAATGPPRRIVLIGIWCIFAIPVLLMIFAMVQSMSQTADGPVVNDDGHIVWGETRPPLTLQQVLNITFILGILLLYAAIIWKTTRNYFRKKQALDIDATNTETTENIGADV